ncbi:MAG: putative transport system ATP-binding protein [Chloroflexota bacterium]|nr:putative transport system ATP-binding protein [Chloroflexota bacterium]
MVSRLGSDSEAEETEREARHAPGVTSNGVRGPHPTEARSMIEVVDVWKSFRSGDRKVEALRGISARIARGRFAFIVGPSGSGKSTLLYLLGALDRPDTGLIRVEGRDLTAMGEAEQNEYRRDKVGFIFQSFNLISNLTAVENVLVPFLPRGVTDAQRTRAAELLKEVGLADRLDHRPYQLSGGEQQRVAIARALIKDPILVLADEPTGELDSRTGDEIYRILRRLQIHRQATLVVVTHDRRFITPDDLVLEIQDGQLKAGAELEPQNDLAEAEVGLETLLGGNNVLEGKDAVQDRANKPTA